MRSHLTRNLFRRLLSNEAFLFRCPHQSEHGLHGPMPLLQLPVRRTLFGFSSKPPRKVKSADLDPGFNRMLDLFLMDKVQARPPAVTDMIKAFNTFFIHKLRTKEAVNNIQAQHALRTFRYIRDSCRGGEGFGLTLLDICAARDAMMKMPSDKLDTHNEFARELYAELTRRSSISGDEQPNPREDLKKLIIVLTETGDSLEARKLIEEYCRAGPQSTNARKWFYVNGGLWNFVLKGFAKELNEVELLNTARFAEASGVPYNRTFHETMTTFYTSKNDVDGAKTWYSKRIDEDNSPTPKTISETLRFCLRNNELDWCNSVFRALLESNPPKLTWDVIFQWAASALGKGVEDVEHMMKVMVRRNLQDDSARPDIETINGLVDLAISRNDPYLAERYLALGLNSGIRPNARTFILQMDYRIDAGDLSGAHVPYEALQSEEVTNQEHLPVINKYIRALCSTSSPNYERIISLVADLDEQKVRPEAATVSALCLLYLRRNELHDAIDILQAHCFHYSLDERAQIRDTFLAYCLDHGNNTATVWDAYTIIREIFDETDTKIRTQLMNEFFDRGRSDMAFHVFGHMRQHIRLEKRPTADTYVECLEGIAKCTDMENLNMVHNMMKMDPSIEPSTRLYNSLMLAYTACGKPYRALDFWSDITNSVEGPTYNSIQIVFHACEVKPFGDKPAREIWNKMRHMEIEVTPEVFSAYVGALSGQALLAEVKALIEGMEVDVGFGPDLMTLGTFYNAAPGQNRKDEIEEWAKKRFPHIWKQLEEVGQRTTLEGNRLFKIVRYVRA